MNFFTKPGYRHREDQTYFEDREDLTGILWQKDVYDFTINTAKLMGLELIIDVGCGSAKKLRNCGLEFIGIDYGPNLPEGGAFIKCNLESGLPENLNFSKAAVICADVLEHLINPEPLLIDFSFCTAPLLVISTPDRDLLHGPTHMGPPDNPCHVREWNHEEFQSLLDYYGIVADIQHVRENDRTNNETTMMAVRLPS